MVTVPLNWRFAFIAFLATAAGCGRGEQVRTYTVPKEVAPVTAGTPPAQIGEPVDRMLAAVVPEGTQAWIYKVVGPIPVMEQQAEKIVEFIVGVPPAGGAEAPPWKLPAGWSVKPGVDGFTLATIQIPAEGKPLDLTVSPLPWNGTQDAVLQNVNRWRGQMGLPLRTSADKLSEDASEMKAGDRTITLVDLRGAFRRSGMPPFAGGAMGGNLPSGPMTGRGGPSQPPAGPMPADHPPVGKSDTPPMASSHGAMPGTAAPATTPKFDAPASWKPDEAGGMNRAAFRVAEGEQVAQVTVGNIPVSSGAMFADPLQNANLWRQGVGLPPIQADELKNTSEVIEIGGKQATLVSAIPGDDKPEGTLAAAVTHGDQIWYFKIKGARQLIADRQEEFKAFLKSVRFAE